MDKIDPNHDLVPTLRMMDGLLFDRAADEIEKWRDAYRKAVQTPAAELMVVGPGWHERFPVITAPIVIDGLLQAHVSDRRDDMADELTRLRAEVEALKVGDALHKVCVQQRDQAWREVESLRAKAAAFDEWLAKTEWVQETAEAGELGTHRADVMRKRIEALRAALKPFAAIDLTTNQAVDAFDVLRARRALGRE